MKPINGFSIITSKFPNSCPLKLFGHLQALQSAFLLTLSASNKALWA